MAEDAELLRRYAESDSQPAFAEFVHRHIRLVYHTALRRSGGRRDVAQDVSQVVFTKAARHARMLARRPSAAGWLHATARSIAKDSLRAEARRLVREAAISAPAQASPAQVEERREFGVLVDDLLAELGSPDRDIIVLHVLEGRTFSAIGRDFSLSEEATRKRSERALSRIRTRLEQRGFTSASAALSSYLAVEASGTVVPAIENAVCSGALIAARRGAPLSQMVGTIPLAAGLAGMAVLISIGIAVRTVKEAAISRDELAQIQLAIGRASTPSPRPTAKTELLAGSHLITPPAAAEPSLPVDPIRSGRALEEGTRFMAEDEESRRLNAIQALKHFDWWESVVGRAIGLPAEQTEQLARLQTQKRGAILTIGDYLQFNQSFGDLSSDEVQKEIRSLVGDAAYARYQDFERTQPARDLVGNIATSLLGDEALDPNQCASLVQLILRSSPEFTAGKNVNLRKLDWESFVASAKAVLTPPQRVRLDAIVAREHAEADLDAFSQAFLADP